MLGLRGCRLGILYPEIIEMVKAIITAACELKKRALMCRDHDPLVGHVNELRLCGSRSYR